jgi:hypothetical protein
LVQGRKIIIEEKFSQKIIRLHWLGVPQEFFEGTSILNSMKEGDFEHATKMWCSRGKFNHTAAYMYP